MNAPALPKRFYDSASCDADDGLVLKLDGRGAKTPGKRDLTASSAAMAQAMVGEWNAVGEHIDAALMPVTQRRMVVLDRGDADRSKWTGLVLDYLDTDLLCYRAENPQELVNRQKQIWDPYLEWISGQVGTRLQVTAGVVAVRQPAGIREKVAAWLENASADELSCVAAATEITGSAVLALALWQRRDEPEHIFAASRVDETWQAEQWGHDSEAVERENKLKRDFLDLAHYLHLAQSD